MLQKVFTLLFASVSLTLGQDIYSYVPYHPAVDNSTYGNIDQIAVTHQHVDWFVNWTNKTLQGSIIMDMTVSTQTQFI
jgi:hypothetical protein